MWTRRALSRAGYRILAERYTCPVGEVDLVARDGGTLVFVEVKTRSSADRYPPGEAVHIRKQRQVARVAEYYLAATQAGAVPCRFDVVAITVPEGGGAPLVEVIRDAFPVEGIETF